MECLKCGKESKYEFCNECKEIKRNASAIVATNKKKLIKLLFKKKFYRPENLQKFIVYSNNIITYGRIYLEYQQVKEYKTLKFIWWITKIASLLLFIRSLFSVVIVRI